MRYGLLRKRYERFSVKININKTKKTKRWE